MRGNRTIWNWSLGTLAALAVGLASTPAIRADEAVYERALPSLAWVISPVEGTSKVSMGSGALIEVRRGLLLTAYHVVADRPGVVAFFPARDKDGELVTEPKHYLEHIEELGMRGRVVSTDKTRDLALIQLERVPDGARAMPIAARSPKPGQAVYAVGNSGVGDGVLWRYRDGKVRQVYRKTFNYQDGQHVEARVVEMTVPTNSGDSGGPIVNGDGELVAITAGVDGKENAVDYGIDATEIAVAVATGLPPGGPLDLATTAPAPSPGRNDVWDLILGKPRTPGFDPAPAPAPAPIPSPSPSPTLAPVARLARVRDEHNVVMNGQRGMEVHVEVQVDHAQGKPCDVCLIVCDEDRKPLQAPAGGLVRVTTRITPRFDGSLFDDVAIFLPYAAINEAAKPDQQHFTFAVDVREVEGDRWIVETPSWGTINRTRRTPQEERVVPS